MASALLWKRASDGFFSRFFLRSLGVLVDNLESVEVRPRVDSEMLKNFGNLQSRGHASAADVEKVGTSSVRVCEVLDGVALLGRGGVDAFEDPLLPDDLAKLALGDGVGQLPVSQLFRFWSDSKGAHPRVDKHFFEVRNLVHIRLEETVRVLDLDHLHVCCLGGAMVRVMRHRALPHGILLRWGHGHMLVGDGCRLRDDIHLFVIGVHSLCRHLIVALVQSNGWRLDGLKLEDRPVLAV